jgi:DNA polymerase-3 subunit epsilon
MDIREIVFDTETTGLSFKDGHKVIEIGALELINRMPTGVSYHQYINPEREIEQSAIRIHGITNESVEHEPRFAEIADDFLEFIAGSALVAHNAPFDMGFLNHELKHIGYPELTNKVIDTLIIARKQFPGARVSLDSLCQRFDVDSTARTFHGALLDSELLADVYLELTGGRQPDMMGVNKFATTNQSSDTTTLQMPTNKEKREPRPFPATEEEIVAHQDFIRNIEHNIW